MEALTIKSHFPNATPSDPQRRAAARRAHRRVCAAMALSIGLLAPSPAMAQITRSCVTSGAGITTCTWSGAGGSGLPIPAGVSEMSFEVYGAQGGCQEGGLGGKAAGRIAVTPGAQWWVEIGQKGSFPLENGGGPGGAPLGGGGGSGPGVPVEGGGSQFGCGGGGRSTVRPCGSVPACAPIIIAGGGGGMPWPFGSIQNAGGAGGEIGQKGADGTQIDGGSAGGGGGGTASAAGSGGTAPVPDTDRSCPQISGPGDPGDVIPGPTAFVGFGGFGGFGCWGGGGGGAGLHGGGGGAAGGSRPGGGGGGGSSYVDPTLSDRSFATGVQTGDGKIVFSYLDPTPPTTTTTTIPQPEADIPVAGSRMRLADSPHPEGRRNLVALLDAAIDLRGVDPRITGATVRIGRPGGPETVLPLPASGWALTGNAPRIDFKYKSSTGPIRAARLLDGRSIRFTATGADALALAGTPQGAVGIVLTIGDVRFCGLFGGTIRRDDGTVFLARRAPAPTQCP